MKTLLKLLAIVLIAAVIYVLSTQPHILINPEKPNPAAEGFSRFYSNFRNNIQQGGNQSNNVLLLPDSNSTELLAHLRRLEAQKKPLPANWRGDNLRRSFKAGDTLKQAADAYSTQEQVTLLWTLPRDYVIKQYFEIEGNMVDMLQALAVSVAPDFTSPVRVYLCANARALVLTDFDDPALRRHCIATTNN